MIKLPYAPLKVKKEVLTKKHDIHSIYNIIKDIPLYELGGTIYLIDKSLNFKVDKYYTCYNEKEDRPYVNMMIDNTCFFQWHSHPFSQNDKYNNLSFPSIEDLDCARTSLQHVFVLLTENAVFVYSYLRDSTLTKLIEFYKKIESYSSKRNNCLKEGWNYDILLKNFLKYKLSYKDMDEYDLFFCVINFKDIDMKELDQIVFKVVKDAYRLKENHLKLKKVSKEF